MYSSVLSDAVVDWGSESPGEEWVNTNREGAEHGKRRTWVGWLCVFTLSAWSRVELVLVLCGWQGGVKLLSWHSIL